MTPLSSNPKEKENYYSQIDVDEIDYYRDAEADVKGESASAEATNQAKEAESLENDDDDVVDKVEAVSASALYSSTSPTMAVDTRHRHSDSELLSNIRFGSLSISVLSPLSLNNKRKYDKTKETDEKNKKTNNISPVSFLGELAITRENKFVYFI